MLPFFRKIRYRLAEDNQFLKYSRYAIGEIVLVVVGILIALYINNWNEERNKRREFDQILVEVEQELIRNINSARNGLLFYHRVDSLSNIFFYDSLTAADYLKDENYAMRVLGVFTGAPNIETDSYQKLLEYSQNISDEQETAISGLEILYGNLKSQFDFQTGAESDHVLKFLDIQMENPFYLVTLGLSQPNSDASEFYVNDFYYRNQIEKFFLITVGNVTPTLEQFEIRLRQSYKKIHRYLSSKNERHSEPLLFTYTAEDFRHLVGTYIKTWDSDLGFYDDVMRNKYEDSTVVSIENDILFYTPYFSDGTDSRREIVPVNKSHFRTELGRGFYQVVYDEKGHEIAYYLKVMDNVRSDSLTALKQKDDAWLLSKDPMFSKDERPLNKYWRWFHACEHMSNHNGQIKFLISRLPEKN